MDSPNTQSREKGFYPSTQLHVKGEHMKQSSICIAGTATHFLFALAVWRSQMESMTPLILLMLFVAGVWAVAAFLFHAEDRYQAERALRVPMERRQPRNV